MVSVRCRCESLQTQQQLAVQSFSIANSSAQNIATLFRCQFETDNPQQKTPPVSSYRR
ncbi:hypothetical protein GR197_28150 [Rhizobium phaseoli]|uniref:Uncharacterized protein n=1 Tax=Rhizobium phaseoli TaxID=396 RepID=A0A7K3UMG4_9HYPH|nr:hypothetical protein [Rhizobium phaseoli]